MHPDIVLIAVVVVTVTEGFGPGVAWAFVGGLTANLLTRAPLGSLPLGLLLVAAGTAGGGRLFGRLAWAYPVVAIGLGSLLLDALTLGVLQMVDPPVGGGSPLPRLVGASVLNAALGAIAIAPTRSLVARVRGEQKPTW